MSLIKRALGKILTSQKTFELFQRFGVHVVPNHFYSPIPDTRGLKSRDALWNRCAVRPSVSLVKLLNIGM